MTIFTPRKSLECQILVTTSQVTTFDMSIQLQLYGRLMQLEIIAAVPNWAQQRRADISVSCTRQGKVGKVARFEGVYVSNALTITDLGYSRLICSELACGLAPSGESG